MFNYESHVVLHKYLFFISDVLDDSNKYRITIAEIFSIMSKYQK